MRVNLLIAIICILTFANSFNRFLSLLRRSPAKTHASKCCEPKHQLAVVFPANSKAMPIPPSGVRL
jgi:hypothetical protein